MKFTKSLDGVERCTVIVRIRLTHEEYTMLKRRGDFLGKTPQEQVTSNAALGVEGMLSDYEMDQSCKGYGS